MRTFPILLAFGAVMPACAEQRSAEELIATAHAALAERHIIVSPNYVGGEKTDNMQILLDLDEVAVVGYPEGGFAVIAKDTDHETLWGYSSAPFDLENPAPGFLDLMTSINDGLAKKNGRSARSAICRAIDNEDLPDHVEPLITTQWYQETPYNNLTPIVDGKHCRTGCTSTALAQVINYYRRPNHFEGTGYAHLWGDNGPDSDTRFEVDFSTLSWDFDQMVSNYGTQEYTEEQANSVANLMYACGLHIHVLYGVEATAGAIPFVLLSKLNYKTKEKASLRDLANGNPVIYERIDHAMIIDGYDDNGFLHFNFGWGGRDDGFYALNDTEFKYHYIGENEDRSYIPGLVTTHFDKTLNEYGEFYVNPRFHTALFDKPRMIDEGHLYNTNVIIQNAITFEGEEYAVEYEEGKKPFAKTDATSFTLEEGITRVPSYLGYGCSGVREIHLPSTLQHISDYAFYSSTIDDVYCAAMIPPTVGTKALPVVPYTPAIWPQKNITIHVPADAIEAYKLAPGWNEYKEFVAIENSEGIEDISTDSSAFSICDGSMNFTADNNPLTVRIINVVGAVVRTFTLTPHTTQCLPLESLTSGIYIIEVNGKSSKIKLP